MWRNPQFPADLVTFTEQILNGKLHYFVQCLRQSFHGAGLLKPISCTVVFSCDCVTLFYISNTFVSKTKLKLAKNKTNAKHHPEAAFLLFENHLLFSSILWSKSNLRYSQKCAKNKGVCFNKIIMIDCHENESENEN